MPAPFLARLPQKYLADTEERVFWDYVIKWINDNLVTVEENAGGSIDVYSTDIFTSEASGDSSSYVQDTDIFRAFTVPNNNYSLVDRDFALVNNSYTLNLPANPSENTIIKVANGNGSTITVNGNGRTINGQTTAQIVRAGSVFDFYYFIDNNRWFIA